jgi:hypothetical protein
MKHWKGIMLGLAMLSTTQITIAQDEKEEQPPKEFNDKVSSVHEIGINSTFFINTFVSFNTVNPTVVSPYALTYRFRIGKGGLRFGIGGMYREQKDVDPSSNFTTTNGNVDVRLGGEFNTPIGRRWRAFVGADFVVGYQTSRSRNTQSGVIVTTALETTEFGGGPVLGIDFMVGKRVKLGTETSVALKRTIDKETVNFSDPQFEDDLAMTNGLTVTFDLPTSLYLVIMF